MRQMTVRWFVRSVSTLVFGATLILIPPSGSEAVDFQPLTDLQTGIGFTSVLTLGPEDPDPGSNADGCIYAANGGGAVHRVCFNSAKAVTDDTVVVDLGSVQNLLGITIDPDSDPAEQRRLVLM